MKVFKSLKKSHVLLVSLVYFNGLLGRKGNEWIVFNILAPVLFLPIPNYLPQPYSNPSSLGNEVQRVMQFTCHTVRDTLEAISLVCL